MGRRQLFLGTEKEKKEAREENKKPPKKIIALDTEDNSKGEVYLINFYDGESHYTFRNRLDAWNYLREQGNAIVWACNMEYDLINLFGEWVDKFLTLTFNESAFIKAQWGGENILFRDTLRHWLMGVKKMGDFIGLPKLEVDGKFNDVEYCRRDTEIVWKFVKEMTARYSDIGADVKNTLPSSAFNLFKKEFCKIDIKRPSDEICEMLMKAAYGGRVEIFKTGMLDGPIDCYDINSLYPFVMASKTYPLPATGEFTEEMDTDREFIANIRISMPRVYIPALPVRWNGKLIFPVGEFEGTWTAPEIRQALEDGAEIKKVNWCYQYSPVTCRPFTEWVNYIYGLRKNTSDPFMSYTLKIFLNSVFGKFTEAGELTIFKNGEVSKLANRPDHSNVVLGAYTTAYGRLTLLQYLRKYQKSLCYCDTDSIFIQDSLKIITGKELGEWKHEGRFSSAHFVLPKTYLNVWDKEFVKNKIQNSVGTEKLKWEDILKVGVSRKAKGIPSKAMAQFFETLSAQYESPIRFRESRRRQITPNVWMKKIRTLKAKYEKREVLKNGETLPLSLG